MKLRHLLPILNTLYFAIVLVAFVKNHGGIDGDYRRDGEFTTDAPTEPGDRGFVLFNRWQFSVDRETALSKSFVCVNISGFGAARAVLWVLAILLEEFRAMYPFGLSFSSYCLLLALPLSLLQWFGIGIILDRFRCRSTSALQSFEGSS